MTTRERLETVLDGGTPDITPYSLYSWMIKTDLFVDEWKRLFDMGFGMCHHMHTVKHIEHDVKSTAVEKLDGTDRYEISYKETPVGKLQLVKRNGWTIEHWLKTPADYKIMTWIIENTELVPCYENYYVESERIGEYGVPVVLGSRTPAMSINVDWAGTEQFCMDLALGLPELHDLYATRKKFFIKENELIAAGPGKYVKWLENLTVDMLGPQRYAELLVSIYNECTPVLEASGKRVMVHYDGELKSIADLIAGAPFHAIDSLTEPPEGDMLYDECRAAWPDKAFWANINVGLYYKADAELREAVIEKRNRAGKRAFAFQISEQLTTNWREKIPVVLKALEELG